MGKVVVFIKICCFIKTLQELPMETLCNVKLTLEIQIKKSLS
jgi:hypothetical protein